MEFMREKMTILKRNHRAHHENGTEARIKGIKGCFSEIINDEDKKS